MDMEDMPASVFSGQATTQLTDRCAPNFVFFRWRKADAHVVSDLTIQLLSLINKLQWQAWVFGFDVSVNL